MSENFNRVRDYLLDLDLRIVNENEAQELVVVQDEESGITNLIIDCEPPSSCWSNSSWKCRESLGISINGSFR